MVNCKSTRTKAKQKEITITEEAREARKQRVRTCQDCRPLKYLLGELLWYAR